MAMRDRKAPEPARAQAFRRTCYHLATQGVAQLARRESIYKNRRFSDHAPITVGYELAL